MLGRDIAERKGSELDFLERGEICMRAVDKSCFAKMGHSWLVT